MDITHRLRPQALQRYLPQLLNHDIPITAGEHHLRINTRILLTYLPALSALAFDAGTINHDGIDLNRITFQHPYQRLPPEYRDTMLDALEMLAKSLARNVDKSEAPSLEITAWLENSLRQRNHRAMERYNSQYAVTYIRFTCLAFLGKLYRSDRIQALISQFFVKYGGRIVSDENHEDMVLNWCSTIVSYLGSAERVGCLKEIIVNRGDVLQDLQTAISYRGDRKGISALRAVEEVMAQMALMQQQRHGGFHRNGNVFEPRGRQRQRMSTGWGDDDDEEDYFRPSRHVSDSPPSDRRITQPWHDPQDHGLVIRCDTRQLAPRRRALSQENNGDRQRMRRLEERLQDVEEAVTFVAMRRLNLAGLPYVRNNRREEELDLF